MKFIIEYGCSVTTEYLAVEAKSLEEAEQYAYQSAYECRESFEGLHGVLDFAEFCEEEEYDEEDDSAWEAYKEMVEWELHYHAHEFDPNNEEDISVLEDNSEGKFFQI